MADFYLDNDVSLRLAPLLRSVGHRVTTTRDLGLSGASDDAQLLTAARNGWILITHNRRDFMMLHDAWRTWPAAFGLALPPHPGSLVLDQALPDVLTNIVSGFLAGMPGESWINELFWWRRAGTWRRRIVGTGWEPYP